MFEGFQRREIIFLVILYQLLILHCIKHNLFCNLKDLRTVLVRDHPAHGVWVLVFVDTLVLGEGLVLARESVDHADTSVDESILSIFVGRRNG